MKTHTQGKKSNPGVLRLNHLPQWAVGGLRKSLSKKCISSFEIQVVKDEVSQMTEPTKSYVPCQNSPNGGKLQAKCSFNHSF